MKYKIVQVLVSFSLLLCSLSANGDLTGYVSGDSSDERVVLTMTFTNKTRHSLCVYHCPISRNEVIDNLLSDEFLVETEDGERVPYTSFLASSGNDLDNRKFCILPPGGDFQAKYNLAKLYELKADKYIVTYYLSVASCDIFNEKSPYFFSPGNLKGFAYMENLNFKQLEKRLYDKEKEYMSIYRMEPVTFEIER